MSAAEIIERIKALPEAEKAIVYQFVQDVKAPAAQPPQSEEDDYIPVEELKKSAQEMFTRYRPLFEKLAK